MTDKYLKYKTKYLNLKNQLGGMEKNGIWDYKKGDPVNNISRKWEGTFKENGNEQSIDIDDDYTIILKNTNKIFIIIDKTVASEKIIEICGRIEGVSILLYGTGSSKSNIVYINSLDNIPNNDDLFNIVVLDKKVYDIIKEKINLYTYLPPLFINEANNLNKIKIIKGLYDYINSNANYEKTNILHPEKTVVTKDVFDNSKGTIQQKTKDVTPKKKTLQNLKISVVESNNENKHETVVEESSSTLRPSVEKLTPVDKNVTVSSSDLNLSALEFAQEQKDASLPALKLEEPVLTPETTNDSKFITDPQSIPVNLATTTDAISSFIHDKKTPAFVPGNITPVTSILNSSAQPFIPEKKVVILSDPQPLRQINATITTTSQTTMSATDEKLQNKPVSSEKKNNKYKASVATTESVLKPTTVDLQDIKAVVAKPTFENNDVVKLTDRHDGDGNVGYNKNTQYRFVKLNEDGINATVKDDIRTKKKTGKEIIFPINILQKVQ